VNVKKGYLARLLEIGKKALEVDAEVYHFHDPDLLFLALKLKKKGKKVIYDVHENYPGILEDTKGKLLGKFLSFSFEKLENYVVRKIDGTIAVTEEILNRFSKFSRSVLVPNYFDLSILNEIALPEKKAIEKIKFVYLGSIYRSRSIVETLKAYKKLRENYDNVSLTLIGPIRDDLIKKFLEENNLKDFKHIPQMPYKSALIETAKCDVGLAIFKKTRNSKFASPNKIFEYAALGLPMIVSDIEYLQKTLEKNPCALYVNPDDPEDIYAKMEIFAKNKKLLEKLKKNCKKLIEEYNWKFCERNIEKLYIEIENKTRTR